MSLLVLKEYNNNGYITRVHHYRLYSIVIHILMVYNNHDIFTIVGIRNKMKYM